MKECFSPYRIIYCNCRNHTIKTAADICSIKENGIPSHVEDE